MGHKKAVLDLAWNNLNRNILASCSADKSVILWDLEQLKQATKIRDNSKKVQSIKFHPIESFSLLSGSSDKTVTLYDCRNPKSNKKVWTLNGETEQVLWNQYEPNNFLVILLALDFVKRCLFDFVFSFFNSVVMVMVMFICLIYVKQNHFSH